jgi:type IV pilus assembly protein PilM
MSHEIELELAAKSSSGPPTPSTAAPSAPPSLDATAKVLCGGCAQENQGGRRFCADCGDPLWVECLTCNAVGAASEKFCGACGVSRQEATQAMLDKGQQCIRQATELRREFRFSDAIARLAPVLTTTHKSLQHQVDQARSLRDQLLEEQQRLKGVAAVAFEEARREMQAAHYSRVQELLEAVPGAFRTDELKTLLREAQQKAGELRRLRREIAAAVQENRLHDATHRIERLLALDPEDAAAERVGRSLSQHLQKAAAKELARHQYGECLRLLDVIPQRFRSDSLARQIEKVQELNWLQADLRQAPYADSLLLNVAQRLLKADPGNPQAARLLERLEQRLRKPAETTEGSLPTPIPWASLPPKSHLGVPIEWITGLRRIQVLDAAVRATWVAHPGQFQVACGLALQGVGRAALSIDLKPKKKSSVLGGLSLGRSRKTTARSAWGIDLSSSALKAVRLSTTSDEEVVVDQCVWMPLARHGSDGDKEHANSGPANSGAAPRDAADALRALAESQAFQGADPVCTNMPGLKLLGRFLRLPRIEGKRWQQVLEFEVRNRIPLPIEELSWDHYVVPDHGEASLESPQSVLVIAAKSFEVERRLALFEEAGIKVGCLQTDGVALHNWLQFEHPTRPAVAESPATPSAVALLDVGSDCTQVIVSWQDSFWFRVLTTGGNEFTRAIVKQFRMTNEQAEQLKQRPGRAKRLSQLYDALDPVSERLRTQLKQSLDAFHVDYPEVAIRQAFGLGGSFGMHGLLNALYESE